MKSKPEPCNRAKSPRPKALNSSRNQSRVSEFLAWVMILTQPGLPAFLASAVALEARAAEAQSPSPASSVLGYKRRAILTFETREAAARVREKLPPGMRVLSSILRLAIIETDRPLTPQDLEALRRIPGVRSATPDSEVKPGDVSSDAEACQAAAPRAHHPSREDAEKLNQLLRGFDKVRRCYADQICDEINSRWAQERVGADLMREELKRIGLKPGHTRVAVVDTGFDELGSAVYFTRKVESKAGSLLQGLSSADSADRIPPGRKIVSGKKIEVRANQDSGDHGTQVASLIGGVNGLGIAPDAQLTSYRITDAVNKSSLSAIFSTVLEACEAGNEVINVSWIMTADENLQSRIEVEHPALLEDLAERGCIVVQSAGNAGHRGEQKTNSTEDAWVRVEAVNSSGDLATFSTLGEIAAPGDGIYVVQPTRVSGNKKPNPGETCLGASGAVVPGTSFAAPIASAIVAEVYGVLKTSPQFASALKGPERVRLINRMIQASRQGRTINAYRAVLIAEQWARSGTAAVPAVATLKADLEAASKARCDSPPPKCPIPGDCTASATCSRELRARMALCPALPPRALLDFAVFAQEEGNVELATAAVLKLAAQGEASKPGLGLPEDFVARLLHRKTSGNTDEFFRLSDFILKAQSVLPSKPQKLREWVDEQARFHLNKIQDEYAALAFAKGLADRRLLTPALVRPMYAKAKPPHRASFRAIVAAFGRGDVESHHQPALAQYLALTATSLVEADMVVLLTIPLEMPRRFKAQIFKDLALRYGSQQPFRILAWDAIMRIQESSDPFSSKELAELRKVIPNPFLE